MGELDFPDEDWCFDVLPELNNLEADTLDALLAQAQQHAKYEHAARALVIHERSKLLDEHETAIRAIRAEAESEATRKNMSSEMKLRQQDDEAHEQQEALRAAANEKIGTLEDSIEELQRTIAQQQKRMDEMESEHAAECDRLRDEGEDAVEAMREAEAETDLKRLASRKLKEEIIDNDRLTVANINRIRHLEALVDQHKAALDEADSENAELRSELERSIEVGHDAKESAEEVATLRDLLAEREGQLLSMSRRMSEVLDARMPIEAERARFNDRALADPRAMGGRRDSLLERFALSARDLASGA